MNEAMTARARNILEEICATKREHVRRCKRERPLSSLDAEAKTAGAPRDPSERPW